MKLNSNIEWYSIDSSFRKRSYRNCSGFTSTATYRDQLQKHLNTKHIILFQLTGFIQFLMVIIHQIQFDVFHNSPLNYAIINDHTTIVELLLSQPGIKINCKDIWIQKLFIKFIFNSFRIFRFEIHFINI